MNTQNMESLIKVEAIAEFLKETIKTLDQNSEETPLLPYQAGQRKLALEIQDFFNL